MKFLADMGISMSTIQVLRSQGEDAVHIREEGLGQLPDAAILEKAREEGRVVLTFDLDFGDLLAAGVHPLPSVIIFRLRNQTPASVTPRLLKVLSECGDDLASGAVVTIEDTRYRLRRLPIEPAANRPSGKKRRNP